MNLLVATIWTPSEMASAQAELLASATGTDTSVSACAALDSATKSEWSTWFAAVQAFCAQVPVMLFAGSGEVHTTGTRADQLQQYQRELLAWQQKLAATKGCSFSPATSPNPNNPAATAVSLVKWGAVAIAFGATAYVASIAAREFDLFRKARAA